MPKVNESSLVKEKFFWPFVYLWEVKVNLLACREARKYFSLLQGVVSRTVVMTGREMGIEKRKTEGNRLEMRADMGAL